MRSPLRSSGTSTLRFQLQRLTVGTYHGCCLTPEGSAYCWGRMSTASWATVPPPTARPRFAVTGGLTFKALEAGGVHTCGFTTEAVTYCWGQNHRGHLGEGPVIQPPSMSAGTIRSVPRPVPGGLRFLTHSRRRIHVRLDRRGGRLPLGGNLHGNFGNEKEVVDGACALSGFSQTRTDPYCWSPVPAASGLTFRTLDLEPGAFHACGLTLEGSMYCWGNNDWGQIGDSTTSSRLTPFRSAGPSYACARTGDGVAYCWGALPWGPLSESSIPYENKLWLPSAPAAVAPELKFRTVSVGYEVACGLTDDGTAHCWGDNQHRSPLGAPTGGMAML
jgi:alpha-tubulin suppressor-like RCC1 family protein